ncbi:hypothetical protein CcCBS67573_g05422 [Chytriomyces confervae]|uniref:Vacuolar protein sorting-associated protein 41 n=1 Tax=Chytriomyces confervae TaxID=246404 RepID=A0A507FCK3_9FUNG|nr:Vacuolar protein sorting-associated protein 41 [Chytriomyces hyalinus]TPX73307.1 hypothetical protein CcCBS67573_g05422 [Chytriomyces confervae]
MQTEAELEKEEHDDNSADDESIESSEEDDDNDDDSDDDEEPMLKYQRLSGTLADTLKKDAVAAMAVSDRFLALGTHGGCVHMLDLAGNAVKRFSSHAASVTCVAIDSCAEFVASASDDGKVAVHALYSSDVSITSSGRHLRPLKALALEHDYARKPTKAIASGGLAGDLVMTAKGWFSSFDTVIASGEGPIGAIAWKGDYVAWANDAGVKIYDVATQQKFAYIDRPVGSPRADLFRCNLCWKDESTLMIGWADSVKVGIVKDRVSNNPILSAQQQVPATTVSIPSKYVEIVCDFRTDFIVAGIAPLLDQIVLLSFIVDLDRVRNVDVLPTEENARIAKRLVSQQPEVHVVDMSGEHVANDVLNVFGYEHYRANDYQLAYLATAGDTTFYIVSPKDIIVARPRNTDDRIKWLTDNSRFEEALHLAEKVMDNRREADGSLYEGTMQVEDVIRIGLGYMKSLMDEENYAKAASMSPKVLRNDAKLWEEWVYLFIGVDKLAEILPFIPYKPETAQLSKTAYEMILSRFLETDKKMFVHLIKTWPTDLYNLKAVTDAVEYLLENQPTDTHLLDAGITLTLATQRFEKALLYGLRLHRPEIMKLVIPQNLFQTMQAHVDLVMAYDFKNAEMKEESVDASRHWTGREEGFLGGPIGESVDIGGTARVLRRAGLEEGVGLLVANTDRAPVSSIVKLLSGKKKYLHVYLDALFRHDPAEGVEFHSMQVELYADFDPTRLLDFLRSSAMYKVQSAYKLCEIRDLVPEMVYLLGKMGDNRRALKLVIDRLGDVKQAIEFAKEQNDDQIWDDLIKYSMDKPPFIIGLLENLGSHIDPVKLIQQIPKGLEIPHLRASLIKIMTDYGIQMSLKDGCAKILVSDAVELMENLHSAQRMALAFSGGDLECNLCDSKILFDDPDKNIVIYFCKHMYHKSCLLSKSIALERSMTDSPIHRPTTAPAHLSAVAPAIPAATARTIAEIYSASSASSVYESARLSTVTRFSVESGSDGAGGLVGVVDTTVPNAEAGRELVTDLDRLMELKEIRGGLGVGVAKGGVGDVPCPLCRV